MGRIRIDIRMLCRRSKEGGVVNVSASGATRCWRRLMRFCCWAAGTLCFLEVQRLDRSEGYFISIAVPSCS